MSRSKELIFLNINIKKLIFRIKTTMGIYIISQILAFIAFLLSLLAYYRSKKEKIMLYYISSERMDEEKQACLFFQGHLRGQQV